MTPTSLNENSLELTIMSAMTGVSMCDLRGANAREIELIHEYRTRLISDVVTGKLQVQQLLAR